MTRDGRQLVAGVDSSTQSVKVVIRDAHDGAWVREGRAPHPDGTEVDPLAWWHALGQACSGGLLDGVTAISVAGQQHGMVALDDSGAVVRPALLWNDTRSATDAAELTTEFGGPGAFAAAVGSVPLAAFTVSKVRWMARVEPENARRTAAIMLPHDYLSWLLADRPTEAATDRGDASGTGYWSPATGEYRRDILELALGHDAQLPRVAAPSEIVGEIGGAARTHLGMAGTDAVVIGPGTGDNMGAALALGIGPGDVVVSLGTSGTAFAGSNAPTADPTGLVAGFADATGRFLPLVCTLNAARVLTSTAELLGVDMDGFARLALAAEPGSGGLTLLPYFDGERTPNLPDARGSLHGISRDNLTPGNIARAAVEGMLGGLADAVDALVAVGVTPRRVILVGGAAANPAVLDVASTLVDVPVQVPPAGEYVADGAARQAAWVLHGGEVPEWSAVREGETLVREANPVPRVRDQYRDAREALYS
ncbi:MAG: xylulokinase [Candidatus Nanopelagicales bacterium]